MKEKGVLRLSACRIIAGLIVLMMSTALFAFMACNGSDSNGTVVVYTSLDQPFSEPILNEFESQTGIEVKAVYDVEAAKTTGLVNRLIAEKNRPQADVFWSSEYAQTSLLKEKGALTPYDSPSAREIPAQYRDSENYWTGFAARARVIIVNTELVPESEYPKSIFDLLDPKWKGEAGIANPLFGTTATHAAALFAYLGVNDARAYFEGLLDNDIHIVNGNSVVRDMVVSGELKVGLTDTDDAYAAVARGEPVEMIFPDQNGLGTLLIPNTVALIQDGPHPEEAKQFIDFLLNPEIEERLAFSTSRQIPVREAVAHPTDMLSLQEIRAMEVHPQAVAEQMPDSSRWLKEAFLK
jgi:iron(III) transport system substrate-binding protein